MQFDGSQDVEGAPAEPRRAPARWLGVLLFGAGLMVVAAFVFVLAVLVLMRAVTPLASRPPALATAAESAEAARPTPRADFATPAPAVVAVLDPTAAGLPPPAGEAPPATPAPAEPPATPAPTVAPGCELYNPADELLIRVDRNTALPRGYEPDDLAAVPLEARNAYYGPLLLRRLVHHPLLDMLEAMTAAGLQATAVSGYRSYNDQALAYEKWLERFPDRAAGISAVPGHSEHQLGTAVDMSAPYMVELFGEQFHPQFMYTKAGHWLIQNARDYGFVLSYPEWAVEQTGYEWEPWHYRYVGVDLARDLTERNVTLSEFIVQCSPAG